MINMNRIGRVQLLHMVIGVIIGAVFVHIKRNKVGKYKKRPFLIFDTKKEAEEVLANLLELIKEYKTITLCDVYDLVGIESSFIDTKYGWTDIKKARIIM